ncbi:MAG: pantetheine-phosphate adenylyltransferase [Clostridia bacterium]|nr:pantetheine-phosphate adenylyltransferase [Clostridia bacterium]
MERVGFYAGSFDPFTNGHLHVIEVSRKMFDKVIVGIGINTLKERRFDQNKMKEAMEKVMESKGYDNVKVITYDNLSVDAAKENGANFLIRGIRNGMDYDYEENVALINEEISGLDTIYVRAGKLGALSSSMVMELLQFGKDVSKFLPKEILEIL